MSAGSRARGKSSGEKKQCGGPAGTDMFCVGAGCHAELSTGRIEGTRGVTVTESRAELVCT